MCVYIYVRVCDGNSVLICSGDWLRGVSLLDSGSKRNGEFGSDVEASGRCVSADKAENGGEAGGEADSPAAPLGILLHHAPQGLSQLCSRHSAASQRASRRCMFLFMHLRVLVCFPPERGLFSLGNLCIYARFKWTHRLIVLLLPVHGNFVFLFMCFCCLVRALSSELINWSDSQCASYLCLWLV